MVDELNTYPEGTPFPGVVGETRETSTPAWPVPPAAPADAPNIVFIVFDDLGYAQLGCYGGLGDRIRTPHLDALAAQGLRYDNFHTTALCSPTRAALLTGRNHHSVGVGTVTFQATGFPGYNARIPRDSVMLPKVLGANGYANYCVGKWHLTPHEHYGPTGPFDRWPLGQGFDRFYGFLPGETDHWNPVLWQDNQLVDPPRTDGYHLTTDLADTAIRWLTEHQTIDRSRPFFLYFATGAPHSPHHAPAEMIGSYEGIFDDGWDAIREQTFARQLDLGVVPEGTVLPPRNPAVSAWDDLTDVDRRVYCRQMETYAAFLEHADAHVGRVLEHLRSSGVFDDTLIVFLSDNGASAEGGRHGLSSEVSYFNGVTESIDEMVDKLDSWGGPTTYPHYATGWAHAGNTPQRWYKAFVHEGGTRDPLIVSWPRHITDGGSVRSQFHHVVDIAPTIYELTTIERPDVVEGAEQKPLEGVSLAYTLTDPDAPTRKSRQYFEMFGHRAIWADGWKAVTMHPAGGVAARIGDPEMETRDGRFEEDDWELYHLDDDFSEARDLAADRPDKLVELQEMWWEDARRFNVLPLDDRTIERSQVRRPEFMQHRHVYTFTSPIRLVRSVSPSVIDVDHDIEAIVTVPAEGCEGVLISNGSLQGGYSLFIDDGQLVYVSNYLGRDHTVIRSAEPVPAGHVKVAMNFRKTAPFAGAVTLHCNEEAVASGQVVRTNPLAYGVAEGLEIGANSGSPIWPGYEPPFRFSGEILEVTLRANGPPRTDSEAEQRMEQYIQ